MIDQTMEEETVDGKFVQEERVARKVMEEGSQFKARVGIFLKP